MVGAEIVSLNGEKLEEAIPAVTPLSVLEDLCAHIRSGRIDPYQVIVLLSQDRGGGNCGYARRTNDLPAEKIIARLEVEKAIILAHLIPPNT